VRSARTGAETEASLSFFFKARANSPPLLGESAWGPLLLYKNGVGAPPPSKSPDGALAPLEGWWIFYPLAPHHPYLFYSQKDRDGGGLVPDGPGATDGTRTGGRE